MNGSEAKTGYLSGTIMTAGPTTETEVRRTLGNGVGIALFFGEERRLMRDRPKRN